MATDLYVRLNTLIDGVIQVELQDVTVEFDSGLVEVKTIQKGLSGFTETGGSVKIDFKSAIPKNGLEFDFLTAIANVEPHQMEVTIGAKSYQSAGVFMNGKVSQSIGASAEATTQWMGNIVQPS